MLFDFEHVILDCDLRHMGNGTHTIQMIWFSQNFFCLRTGAHRILSSAVHASETSKMATNKTMLT